MNTEDDLKNISSFNVKALKLGIPSKLLGGVVGLSLIVCVMMSVFLGLLILFVIVVPLYIIHSGDPDASSLYMSEFMSAERYTFDDIEQAYPIIIVNEDSTSSDYEDYIETKRNA